MGGDRFLEPRGHKVEGLVPTGLDAVDDRRDCETRAVAAGEFLGEAEARRQIEPADAARCADKAGDDADALAEALRHYLEHRAIAGAGRSMATMTGSAILRSARPRLTIRSTATRP